MSEKTLKILAVLTVLIVIGAGAASLLRASRGGPDVPDTLFADLRDHVNEVAGVTVTKGQDSLEIGRREGNWVVVSRDGYPAKFETVKAVIMGMAGLKPVEPKTSKAELFEQIGVEDPGPGAESTLVRLTAADGQELASLIVGDRAAGGGAGRMYVRRTEQDESWLVEGSLDVSPSVASWIDRELIRLPRDRIRRVTVTHPDGQILAISRADKEEKDFQIEDLPEDRIAKSASIVGGLAGSLAYLSLDDVKAGADPWNAVETKYETFDGLTVTVVSWQEEDGTYWVTLDAAAEEAETPVLEETPAPVEAADEGVEDETPEQTATEEAASLRSKLGGWRFAISSYKAESLRKRVEDLTDPKPAEEPAEATGDAAAGDDGAGASPAGGGNEAGGGG